MVAKITVGTSLYGALAYNGMKVNEGEGKLLAGNKVFDDGSGRVDIARAVEAEGADSVSLINMLMGMAVDIEKRQPLLSIRTGGLSGPCVKPVALRMVWDVAHAVNIPVVGLGGISSAKDAIEFLMCGATAIEIGTANFIDPAVTKKVKDGINEWLDAHGCKNVTEIIGAIK